jgi:hypothetical protein
MDDREERRIQREARELDHMRKLLEDSRKRVGVESMDLKAVVAAALGRAGASLDAARAGKIGGAELFRLDPATPVFGHGGWQEARNVRRDWFARDRLPSSSSALCR